MSNLLPSEALSAVWRRFNYRVLFVGSLVFLFSAFFAAIALLPSYIIPKIEQGVLLKRDVQATEAAELESVAEKDEILRSREVLLRATPLIFATSSPTELVSSILSRRPKGLQINRISFTSGREGTIILEGNVASREEINQYREELSKDVRFTAVSIPVGSLVEAGGGRFTITLKGAF